MRRLMVDSMRNTSDAVDWLCAASVDLFAHVGRPQALARKRNSDLFERKLRSEGFLRADDGIWLGRPVAADIRPSRMTTHCGVGPVEARRAGKAELSKENSSYPRCVIASRAVSRRVRGR